ncbi:ubiquitin carboxyl-terminal hydrolase 38-like [Amphiura filiformis]|uniref:ubiquitin carboxyl-terminal hydrolase 38-like n=1 Tax=Amphiura filiformis TaxID=82378 RepID=UPI003B21B8B0
MDKILLGVAASTHPIGVKKALVSKLITSASKPIPEEQLMAIFDLSSRWIIEGEDEFQQDMGDQVFTAWSKCNQTVMEQFFTHQFLIGVIGGDVDHPQAVVGFIHKCIKMLHNRESACKIVQTLTITLARESKDTSSLAELSRLLVAFPDCLPKGDFIKTLCITVIQSMSKTKVPNTEEEVKRSLEDVAQIGVLLQQIWRDNLTSIIPSLTAIFGLISNVVDGDEDANPSVALGALVQHVPVEMITVVTERVAKDRGIPDAHMTAALTRMIDWLSWPGVCNIDRWIVGFLQNLAKAQKFTILINVTLATVEKVSICLGYVFPLLEKSALPVLTHMLLSFQHSPEAFHKIAAHIPELLQRLKEENSPSSQECEKDIAELTYCLMYQHAGYPEIYEPVLDSLFHIPRPVDDVIVERLKQSAWTSQGEAASSSLSFRFAPRSETGKTGLVNLGNTCYMNSVLQALYMTSGFREEILSATVYNKKAVLGTLQKTFAFQSHTQRAAYSPRDFLKASRPPWFNPGSQQDCSEFLKFLLDRLDDEEKAIRKFERTVADYQAKQQQEHLKRSEVPPEGKGERSPTGVVASAKKILKVRPKQLPLENTNNGDVTAETALEEREEEGYVVVSKSDDESTDKEEEEKVVKELGAAVQGGDASSENYKQTIVEKYFGGKSTTHIRCHKCNCVSNRTETFFDLPLAFPESNGKSMLGGESNLEREQVESEKLSTNNAGGSVRSPDVPMVTVRQPSQEGAVYGPMPPPGHCSSQGVVYGPLPPPGHISEGALNEHMQTTVQEMLSHYLTPEVLTGDNKYHCENCQSLQDAEKSIEIVKSPHILVLSLMRFSYDVKTHRRCKILTDVKFPQVLNMQMKYEKDESMDIDGEQRCETDKPTQLQSHLPPCTKRVRANSTTEGSSSSPQTENNGHERQYVLTAVIVHSGLSSESGHYYCYARPSDVITGANRSSKLSKSDDTSDKAGDVGSQEEEDDPLPDRWYLFNDSRVSFSSYESFGNVTKRFPKDTAYLLFYQQMPGYNDEEIEKQELERIRDKLLRKDLQEAVTKDNATYLQEREIEARTMALKTSTPQTNTGFGFRNFNDRNDPPGGCGGGGGGFGSPRLVF